MADFKKFVGPIMTPALYWNTTRESIRNRWRLSKSLIFQFLNTSTLLRAPFLRQSSRKYLHCSYTGWNTWIFAKIVGRIRSSQSYFRLSPPKGVDFQKYEKFIQYSTSPILKSQKIISSYILSTYLFIFSIFIPLLSPFYSEMSKGVVLRINEILPKI